MDEELDKDEIEDTDEEEQDDFTDIPIPGKIPGKSAKSKSEEDLLSLSDIEDEEDEPLPEDRFDDVEPEQLW